MWIYSECVLWISLTNWLCFWNKLWPIYKLQRFSALSRFHHQQQSSYTNWHIFKTFKTSAEFWAALIHHYSAARFKVSHVTLQLSHPYRPPKGIHLTPNLAATLINMFIFLSEYTVCSTNELLNRPLSYYCQRTKQPFLSFSIKFVMLLRMHMIAAHITFCSLFIFSIYVSQT